jgi:shikimate kinase
VKEAKKLLLIGPMGAGKSTLGKILSKELSWEYFDNDLDFRSTHGLSLRDLENLPVNELHKLEREYLIEIINRPAPFISGAAGSVVDTEPIRELIKTTFAVYLRLPLEKIIERAGTAGVGRQAIASNGIQILTERFERRDPFYKECSKVTIELSDSPEADAKKILDLL